jgi:SNF2 family DNA or RNA helicase
MTNGPIENSTGPSRPNHSGMPHAATDRAYRIGQTRDVHVDYPTVMSEGLTTFEKTLDHLLTRKRALATDMLNGVGEIEISEFAIEV